MKRPCYECGYEIRVCELCDAVIPPTAHGATRYCEVCRKQNRAEYNRVKQGETRQRRVEWERRVAALERQLAAND